MLDGRLRVLGVTSCLIVVAAQPAVRAARGEEQGGSQHWMPLIQAGSYDEAKQLCSGWCRERHRWSPARSLVLRVFGVRNPG